MNIGLIGNGHLGKAFARRLDGSREHLLLVSEGRGCNKELASASNVVVLAVRPMQLRSVVDEIRNFIGEAGVISFTAATPQADLEASLDRPVIRAMTDIDFEQVLSTGDFGGLLAEVSKNPLIEVADEELVDAHTILVGCLPGVIAWQMLNNRAGATDWLRDYFHFIQAKLQINQEVIEKILFQGLMDETPAMTLQKVATPGGITESLVQKLSRDADCSFDELYAAGWERTERVRKAVGQSLRA